MTEQPPQGPPPQDPDRRIETPGVDVPPPPANAQRRSPWRWVGIGLGGCLSLFVLLFIFVGCLESR